MSTDASVEVRTHPAPAVERRSYASFEPDLGASGI